MSSLRSRIGFIGFSHLVHSKWGLPLLIHINRVREIVEYLISVYAHECNEYLNFNISLKHSWIFIINQLILRLFPFWPLACWEMTIPKYKNTIGSRYLSLCGQKIYESDQKDVRRLLLNVLLHYLYILMCGSLILINNNGNSSCIFIPACVYYQI